MAADSLTLPYIGEFSPGVLKGDNPLRDALQVVADNEGDRAALMEAIRVRWLTGSATKRATSKEQLRQQLTRALNVFLGMRSYGLFDDDCRLTAIGRELLDESDDAIQAARFATHMLKDRQGLELLAIVRDLQDRRIKITNDSLRAELRRRGYEVKHNRGDEGKARQWLERAGVIDSKWVIDEARVGDLLGTSLAIVGEWQSMTRAQRAFLMTLRRLAETRGAVPVPSRELIEFVMDEHGPVFREGQLKAKVYKPLADGGWVTHDYPKDGRGGKGGALTPTTKLIDVDFELLMGFKPGDLPADLRAAFATPLEDIYRDLKPAGKTKAGDYRKGIALELLAVNLASDLGLVPVRLRIRGTTTGGAEVDLVAEAAHLHFHRWLFQCKNTKGVDVGVLAKEIGMATLLQAQVIVIATTGKAYESVKTYAERLSLTTPFQVVIIEGSDLEDYRTGGALALRSRFKRDAALAMLLKRPQVIDTLNELAEDES